MYRCVLAILFVFIAANNSTAEEINFYNSICKQQILSFIDASSSQDEETLGFGLLMCLAKTKYVQIDQNSQPQFNSAEAHYQVFPTSKTIKFSTGEPKKKLASLSVSSCSCSEGSQGVGGGLLGNGPSPKYEAPSSFAVLVNPSELAATSKHDFVGSMATLNSFQELSSQPPFKTGEALKYLLKSRGVDFAATSSACTCNNYDAALQAAGMAGTGGVTKYELPDNLIFLDLSQGLRVLSGE